MLSYITEHPLFINSTCIKYLLNDTVCILNVLGLDMVELVKSMVQGGKKGTNQITSQINVIINCVTYNRGKIPRGRRAYKSGI